MYCLLFYTKMPLFEKSIYNISHRRFHNSTMKVKEKLKAWRLDTTACHSMKVKYIRMSGRFTFHGAAEESKNTRHH